MTNNLSDKITAPVRLKIDGEALVSNWRALSNASGKASTGAAVKADGYGLGAREVVKRLSDAGCQDFFVAHWAEAVAIADLVPAEQISVLNGVTKDDLSVALSLGARPVLNNTAQIMRWKAAGGGRCHVMLDSGINRLGLGPEQISTELFDGLDIDILMSHLASADEDVPQNAAQLALFRLMQANIVHQRLSLANSAGIALGSDHHFDLTRPGLSLYGGVPRAELKNTIKQVVQIEAQILQVREVQAGQHLGYNATFKCLKNTQIATIAIGYADGYLRAFSNIGCCRYKEIELPVIGRVSMDLVTIDVSDCANISEGAWVEIDYNLPQAAAVSGISQYELLTGLGRRFDRVFVD